MGGGAANRKQKRKRTLCFAGKERLTGCCAESPAKRDHSGLQTTKTPQSQPLRPAISSRAGQEASKDRERGSERKLRNRITAGRGRKTGACDREERVIRAVVAIDS